MSNIDHQKHQKQENREADVSKLSLAERLKADLRGAMKARQSSTVTTIRSMLAAIDNAGAVEQDAAIKPAVGRSGDVPRKELTEEQVRALLQNEADNRRAAITTYARLGRQADADCLRAELQVFAQYLDNSTSD